MTNAMQRKTYLTGIVLVLSLVLGSLAYVALAARYTPPEEERPTQLRLSVVAEEVFPEDVQVALQGFGETRAAATAPLSAKVAGEVVWLHPKLKSGQRLAAGESLIRIDASDYEIAAAQAAEQVRQAEAALARLDAQWAADRGRIETVRRNYELAKTEYQRDQTLLAEERIGSDAMLNATEANLNTAKDVYDQVRKALDLYPALLEEGKSALESARLNAKRAALELERCEIKAPFAGRVKLVQVELGQTIAPGLPLVVLADDSYLEIAVPLDADVARTRLQFVDEASAPDQAWFADLRPVDCTVTWSEGKSHQQWTGTLDRVERFDQVTRTITVAVRVTAAQAATGSAPLVEGMFCKVAIPGVVLHDVYQLPRYTVAYDDTVYIAEPHTDGSLRLGRAQVTVVHQQEDSVLIRDGLQPGTRVITTRLSAPLPHTPLDLLPPETVRGGLPADVAAGPTP